MFGGDGYAHCVDGDDGFMMVYTYFEMHKVVYLSMCGSFYVNCASKLLIKNNVALSLCNTIMMISHQFLTIIDTCCLNDKAIDLSPYLTSA